MRTATPPRPVGLSASAIAAALVVAPLLGAAVATTLPWHPRPSYEDLEAHRARRLRAMALPYLAGVRLPAPPPTLRVVVTSTGIDLDHAAVVASWRPQHRAAVLAQLDEAWSEAVPFVWRGLVPVVGGEVPAQHRREDWRARLLPRLSERVDAVRRLEEMHAEVSGSPEPHEAAVYANHDVPSSVVFDALYALHQEGYSTFYLVARGARGDTAVVLRHPPRDEPLDDLQLTLRITEAGYALAAAGGPVLPGCQAVGEGSPATAGDSATRIDGDVPALSRCVRALRAQFADELRERHTVYVAPTRAAAWGALVRSIDALREVSPGACANDHTSSGCLFPDVQIDPRPNETGRPWLRRRRGTRRR